MTFQWVVTCGLHNGEDYPALTRAFVLTAEEYDGGRRGDLRFLEVHAAANAYALHLQLQATVRGPRWTRVEFSATV